jgi:hypothetical protein
MAMTEIEYPVYWVPMPLNKKGHGPASEKDTVLIVHEIWDQNALCILQCSSEEIAKAIAQLMNEKAKQA